MTKARPQYAGASYRFTIRCSERRYMLSPGYPEVANLMGYMFSTAANRYGILVHSLCVMSDHLHSDCTDSNGRWSDFCRDFASQSARALNAFHGRWEATWTKSSSQEVVTRQAALNGMAYTIANPVRAGLVASPRAWPGLMTCAEDIPTADDTCTAWEFTRPTFFFRHEEDGGLPDCSTGGPGTTSATLSRPRGGSWRERSAAASGPPTRSMPSRGTDTCRGWC